MEIDRSLVAPPACSQRVARVSPATPSSHLEPCEAEGATEVEKGPSGTLCSTFGYIRIGRVGQNNSHTLITHTHNSSTAAAWICATSFRVVRAHPHPHVSFGTLFFSAPLRGVWARGPQGIALKTTNFVGGGAAAGFTTPLRAKNDEVLVYSSRHQSPA